jgi:hypothetical protein
VKMGGGDLPKKIRPLLGVIGYVGFCLVVTEKNTCGQLWPTPKFWIKALLFLV